MKKYILSLIISLALFPLIMAQNVNYSKNYKLSDEPKYYQDFLSFPSENNNLSRLDVYIQVPYKNIQFIKSPQGFTAKYSVTASIFDEDKDKLLVEKTWNETVDQIDFTQTTNKENFNISMRSFELAPGNYTIRTAVVDRDSRQEFSSENKFKVRNFNDDITMSDIMLTSGVTSLQGDTRLIPNLSRNITTKKENVSLYYEIYSDIDTSKNIGITYEIREKNDDVLYKETSQKLIEPGKNQVIYNLKNVELELGTFLIHVTLSNNDGDLIAEGNKSFFSRWVGLPSSIKNLERAVAQLVYIATPEELDYIEEGETNEEQTKRFLEFWKKKDPSPGNEENQVFDEYYRRIAYANENFSNYSEGWRSDMGMVFVILGPPNNIDRHPFEYDSKPYEVWEYYDLNKSFIFVDETGFGDYRLITPLYGDLYRYRP